MPKILKLVGNFKKTLISTAYFIQNFTKALLLKIYLKALIKIFFLKNLLKYYYAREVLFLKKLY